jgi:protein-tyrosine phosphatase
MGFVDIHSHVLPGIDDGAGTLEESVAMALQAAASGTSDLVATPHASNAYPYDRKVAQSLCDDLQDAVGSAVRIHLGCDFHFSYSNIQAALADPMHFTVNKAGYLLVEFSDLAIPPNAGEVLAQLREGGITPVITHPERNAMLRRNIALLRDWSDQGTYLQVTGQSLLGHFGREAQEASDQLIQEGRVHFVASDGHDWEARPTRLDKAYAHLVSRFGEPYAQLLVEQYPRAVLSGARLPRGQRPSAAAPKWYAFWK